MIVNRKWSDRSGKQMLICKTISKAQNPPCNLVYGDFWSYLNKENALPVALKAIIFKCMQCQGGGICKNNKEALREMTFVERQPGDRRWGLSDDFPLTDRYGLIVIHNRRNGKDRRKTTTNKEVLKSYTEPPSRDT